MSPGKAESSNEANLAEEFYRHRGDLAGEEVPSVTPARLDVMVSARFSAQEAQALRRAADGAGMTLSAFLRQCALAASQTNVIDLDRVRQDVVRLRDLASDALRALA